MRPSFSPTNLSRLAACAALLGLAACSNDSPVKRNGFRADVPIYSNAVLDLRQTSGRWTQAAAFTRDPESDCRAGGASLIETKTGLTILARLCLNGKPVDINSPLDMTGPGRLTPKDAPPPLDRAWWVLWADTDLRTLVIGTPDGSFGFILNRNAPLTPDRLAAAKQVLAFNGYDVSRLSVW